MKIIYWDINEHYSTNNLYELEDTHIPTIGDLVSIDHESLHIMGKVIERLIHYTKKGKIVYIGLQLEKE